MSAQLLNSADRCVDEALKGFLAAHPALTTIPDQRVVVERSWVSVDVAAPRKVALVSGGGSGHEPFSAGYVGTGMLAAAVAGPVFTSPPTSSVIAAVEAVGTNNPAGVLVIVFNYTGDRLNFGLAVERCRAAGIRVDMVVSGDDCALTQLEGTAGRRGLCGTLFIFKIAGALAEAGSSLEEILVVCERVSGALGTIGVAASGCSLPNSSAPLFTVSPGQLELGLGVHGEAGADTIKAGSAKEVVAAMLAQMTRSDSESHLALAKDDQVAVLVNNLGATSQLEMHVMANEFVLQLECFGVRVMRLYIGSYMTSLDMKGVHMTVLRILDPTWLDLLDSPTSAPAWPAPATARATKSHLFFPTLGSQYLQQDKMKGFTLSAPGAECLKEALVMVVNTVPKHETLLNALDAGCGDGDCGSTLCLGLAALGPRLASLHYAKPALVLTAVADVATSAMGGSSGALYSILLTAASAHMMAAESSPGVSEAGVWAGALRAGCLAISKYGGAVQGDRTMLDALVPAMQVLEASTQAPSDLYTLLQSMTKAADQGAKGTTNMKARAGRASYVRAESVTDEDAGARAVVCLLQAIASSLQ